MNIPTWQTDILDDIVNRLSEVSKFTVSADELMRFVNERAVLEHRNPARTRVGYEKLARTLLANSSRVVRRVNDRLQQRIPVAKTELPGTDLPLDHVFRFTVSEDVSAAGVEERIKQLATQRWGDGATVLGVEKAGDVVTVKLRSHIFYPVLYDAFRELAWIK